MKTDIENSNSQFDQHTAPNTNERTNDRVDQLSTLERDNSILDQVAPLLPDPPRVRESVALHRQSVSELLAIKGFALSRENSRVSVLRTSGPRN